MKKYLLSFTFLILASYFSFSSNDYKSIEEVKSLNYELFEEIGLDENKINFVSRVIYSTYKKAQYMASKGSAPQKGVSIDKEAEEMLLRVLTQSEFKALDAVKHKLK